jgi:hypothetical protein
MLHSPSFKETLSNMMSGFKAQIYKTDEECIVAEWTAQHNFRFPPPLMSDDTDVAAEVFVSERFRVIHEEPRPNTLLYLLLSQYNPWLDCEMTREKRAHLKPHLGEVSCAVLASASSAAPTSTAAAAAAAFRNETMIDIANLYLWPLLHSRADEVVACRTFADWRRLFARTITLAFPDYNKWVDIATAKPSAFVSISERKMTMSFLKTLNPARTLYLLTTRAGFWPYGPSSHAEADGIGARAHRWSLSLSSSVSTSHTTTGLCSIKQKIKEYNDTTEIEWLVRADFLKKMKRVHLYIVSSTTTAAAAAAAAAAMSSAAGFVYDSDND